MTDHLEPDPSLIGGVSKPPFAFLPEPVKLFQSRARRFAFLAKSNALAPYLSLLAEISRLQAYLAATLPPVAAVAIARRAEAARGAMPPIDRLALSGDPALAAVLDAFVDGAAGLAMPEPARLALDAVRAAHAGDRAWLFSNILSDHVPEDSVAPHLFAAAAVQVHLARLAETLDADALASVGTGLCPACGGRPATSSVMGSQGIENVRYAACACCATRWNEVRIKCLCCGSTKGISYRSVETTEATVKAEACRECHSWVKIFYTQTNPSLGLDILMKETEFRRGGFNPYLAGY